MRISMVVTRIQVTGKTKCIVKIGINSWTYYLKSVTRGNCPGNVENIIRFWRYLNETKRYFYCFVWFSINIIFPKYRIFAKKKTQRSTWTINLRNRLCSKLVEFQVTSLYNFVTEHFPASRDRQQPFTFRETTYGVPYFSSTTTNNISVTYTLNAHVYWYVWICHTNILMLHTAI